MSKTDNTEDAAPNRLLVGLTGSVAVLMAPIYLNLLRLTGVASRIEVIASRSALRFITVEALQLSADGPIYTDDSPVTSEVRVPHVVLPARADAYLVMPATANVIGKIANGICDDLITTAVVASSAPVVIAPAMNELMWMNPAVRANVERIRSFGHHVIEPSTALRASDMEENLGSLAQPDVIAAEVRTILEQRRHAVVTALDEVLS